MFEVFTSWSDFQPGGQRVPAAELVQLFSSLGWRETLERLAQFAALDFSASQESSDELRSRIRVALASTIANGLEWTAETAGVRNATFGAAALADPSRIVHEALFHFTAAMAVLYGQDSGPAPSDYGLVLAMLAANDHVFDWKDEQAAASLTSEERTVTDVVRALQFNTTSVRYGRAALVRSRFMFEKKPRNIRALAPGGWDKFLSDALGGPWRATLSGVFASIQAQALGRWGRLQADGTRTSTTIDFTGERAGMFLEDYLRSISASRDALRAELRKDLGKRGTLPVAARPFFRRAFVDFGDGRHCCPVPRCVVDQVVTGVWGRLREQAARTSGGSSRWLPAFGDLVEGWCHTYVKFASIVDDALVDSVGASSQIEDVVLRDGADFALFSVKASLLAENIAKGGAKRLALIGRLERFLFADPVFNEKGRLQHRAGALKQLDRNITAFVSTRGKPEARALFPVLVTYDQYGLDCEPCYLWLDQRCEAEELFLRTEPVVCISIGDFESLIDAAERFGRSVVSLLREYVQRGRATEFGSLQSFLSQLGEIPVCRHASELFSKLVDEGKDELKRRGM